MTLPDFVLDSDNDFSKFLLAKSSAKIRISGIDDVDNEYSLSQKASELKEKFSSYCMKSMLILSSIREKFVSKNETIDDLILKILKSFTKKAIHILEKMSKNSLENRDGKIELLKKDDIFNEEPKSLRPYEINYQIYKVVSCFESIFILIKSVESNKDFNELFGEKYRQKNIAV